MPRPVDMPLGQPQPDIQRPTPKTVPVDWPRPGPFGAEATAYEYAEDQVVRGKPGSLSPHPAYACVGLSPNEPTAGVMRRNPLTPRVRTAAPPARWMGRGASPGPSLQNGGMRPE
jgi:hypothetical protein